MKNKKLIYGLSFAVAAFACAGAISFNVTASADGETPTYTLAEEDLIMPGASVRLEDDGQNGIRFPVRMLLDDYTTNEAYITKTGTLVVPADSYTSDNDFTLAGAEANTKIVNNDTTEKWFIREETENQVTTRYAETLTYMYNFPAEHLDTDFYVRGYVTMTDGTTIYSAIEHRSMSYVADAALKSGEYEANRTTLEGYLAKYTVSFSEASVEAQTVKYGQTATDPNYSSEIFRYWTADGENSFDFATEIKSDVTLTAVNKQEVSLTGEYDIDVINADETLKIENLNGTVESITIDEDTVDATYADGVLKADLSSMNLKTEKTATSASGLGTGVNAELETETVKITTDTTVYTLTATLWARVVSNATELQAMLNTFNGTGTTTTYIDADYCLDENINATGLTSSVNAAYFCGIWDGKGHTISNLAAPSAGTKDGGIMKAVCYSATIKNIAFVGGTGERCYLAARMGGIIDNVYVEATIKYTTSYYGVFQKVGQITGASDKCTIKNSVFNITMTNATGCNGLGGIVGCWTHGTVENTYAINNSANAMGSYPLYLANNTAKTEKITDFSTAKGYEGESAFLGDNTVAFSTDNGWASYWKLENGKLYFNNMVVME